MTPESWFGFWRFRCLELVMLLCVLALRVEVSILVSCYRQIKQSKREKKQSYGQPDQPPSQLDNSPRRFLGIFSKSDIQSGNAKPVSLAVWLQSNVVQKLLNLSRRGFSEKRANLLMIISLRDFFGRWKRIHADKVPTR